MKNNTPHAQLPTRCGSPLAAVAMLCLSAVYAHAQVTVTTVFTNGLNQPYAVVTDASGNAYISDSLNNRIVRFDAVSQTASTLAGIAADPAGSNDGPSYLAHLNNPQGLVAVSGISNSKLGSPQPVDGLVVADSGNQLIRFVRFSADPSVNGYVTTLAGQIGGGAATNAAGANATFRYPAGLALDGGGNIYIADWGNNAIRVLNINDSLCGVTNLVITNTTLYRPTALAYAGTNSSGAGQLWIADTGDQTVKLLTLDSAVSGHVTLTLGANRVAGAADSVFGSNARFNGPDGLLWVNDLGLLISDGANNSVRLASNNPIDGTPNYSVVTYAGQSGKAGYADGAALAALFNSPGGLAQDVLNNGFLVADINNNAIRRIVAGSVLVAAPILDTNANWGYYPMGRTISVTSTVTNVHYTIDGSQPSLSSPTVPMSGNTGLIPWFNPAADLSQLRVTAFLGTNVSVTATGQSAPTNTIGIAGPGADGVIPAGVGSTVVVPVVVNLTPGSQIKSYQFRVEVAPVQSGAPVIGNGFQSLVVSANDFVPLVTSQGSSTLNLPGQAYTLGATNGLAISTVNHGSFQFQNFAVVTLLAVPIPASATVGSTYSLAVSYPSATSDGKEAAVNLTPMPPAIILVTNIAYTVGDSGSPLGGWYNAGSFGNGKIDNADVNDAFYAAVGLSVPYAFSDVFNAMDAYPPDASGFVGGDGQIRFLDWQVIQQRSLGLDTNNWSRFWTGTGNLGNSSIVLPQPMLRQPKGAVSWPWYRQALVGAVSVGNATPGSTVQVPVYVKLQDGVSLSGLQFRALVLPQSGAPVLAQAAQLNVATGVPAPSLTQGSQAADVAAGWSLGAFNLQSRSSNFLGWVSFTIPVTAQTGQAYSVVLTNVDGAPDLETAYDLESRSASVVVNAPAPAASICSDDWKLHFFGSLSDPRAADLADPDGDGMPNWMEYLAGTDPTNPHSKLQFSAAQQGMGVSPVNLQWLTAPGKAYEVQWSAQAARGPWQVLTTVSGDGSVASCPDPSASAQARYYRLHLTP